MLCTSINTRMIQGTIANSVIKIALEGFANVQKQMNSLRIQGELTIQTVTRAGKEAGKTADETARSASKADSAYKNLNKSVLALSGIFAASTVAIRSFASAADPRGALELELAFVRLQVAIGRNFIPLIREAAVRINQLAAWLNSLNQETRETVLQWTKFGLVVTGVASGLGVVGGIVARLVGVFAPLVRILPAVVSWFWRILGFLGPWGRLVVIIGTVAAALFGLSKAGQDASSTMGRLRSFAVSAWEAISDGFGKLWAVVGPVLERIEDAIGKGLTLAVNSLVPVFTAVGKVLGASFERQFGTVVKLVNAAMPVFDKFASRISSLFGGFDPEKVQAFFVGIGRQIEAVIPSIHKIFDFIDSVIDRFGELNRVASGFQLDFDTSGLLTALQPVLNLFQTIGNTARNLFVGLSDLWDAAWAGVNRQLDKLQPQFEKISGVVREVFGFAAEMASRLGAALEGIASRVGPPLLALFESLGVLVGKLFDLASALVGAIGNNLAVGFQRLSTVVGPVLDFIGDKLQWILDKLVDGFNAVKERKANGVHAIFRE
jgi:hypothetical protein